MAPSEIYTSPVVEMPQTQKPEHRGKSSFLSNLLSNLLPSPSLVCHFSSPSSLSRITETTLPIHTHTYIQILTLYIPSRLSRRWMHRHVNEKSLKPTCARARACGVASLALHAAACRRRGSFHHLLTCAMSQHRQSQPPPPRRPNSSTSRSSNNRQQRQPHHHHHAMRLRFLDPSSLSYFFGRTPASLLIVPSFPSSSITSPSTRTNITDTGTDTDTCTVMDSLYSTSPPKDIISVLDPPPPHY